jgi:hypothetical protein
VLLLAEQQQRNLHEVAGISAEVAAMGAGFWAGALMASDGIFQAALRSW